MSLRCRSRQLNEHAPPLSRPARAPLPVRRRSHGRDLHSIVQQNRHRALRRLHRLGPPRCPIRGAPRELARLRLRSAFLRASPCRGSASTGFPFGAPPAAVKVTLAVPVHGSWADRFIKHDPRSARGLILPSLIDARHFPPRPGSVPGPPGCIPLAPNPCAFRSRSLHFCSSGGQD